MGKYKVHAEEVHKIRSPSPGGGLSAQHSGPQRHLSSCSDSHMAPQDTCSDIPFPGGKSGVTFAEDVENVVFVNADDPDHITIK